MGVTKARKDIFLDIDESRSIESNFMDTFESGYIALHPFYKRVFQDDFDYRRNLKDTFHLIESVTWDKVKTDLKFKDLKQLANALLTINSSDLKELEDFVEYKRLLFPVIEEDTIPEVLLNKYLQYLKGHGIKEVISGYSKHTIFEDDRQNNRIEFDEKNLFEVIGLLHHKFVVTVDSLNIVLLLPDHDCPYTLILGDKVLVETFIRDFDVEGFWVDKKTNFDWWRE